MLEGFETSYPGFPPVPERGHFDLGKILESPYFFNWTFLQRKLLQYSMKCCYLHFWGKIVQNLLLLRKHFIRSEVVIQRKTPSCFWERPGKKSPVTRMLKQYLFGWFKKRKTFIISYIILAISSTQTEFVERLKHNAELKTLADFDNVNHFLSVYLYNVWISVLHLRL